MARDASDAVSEPVQADRWEAEAADWIAWARTPGHDAYWDYSPRFFEWIVPRPAGWTLEIGCGEGRVARDLSSRGHRVVAVDPAPSLVAAARAADPRGRYVRADGAHLPFAEGIFETVVAYNSLMDVDDMPATVAEAARVLVPGGWLCVCVTHPMNGPGSFDGPEVDSPFAIAGSYLGTHEFDGTFERDGLTMRFRGFSHSLESYARALEAAGLVIERIREPAPTDAAVAADPTAARWRRIPMFLFLRAVKPGEGGGTREPR